jgi:hypothetical protein
MIKIFFRQPIPLILVLCCGFLITTAAAEYLYDPSDFATEVIQYQPGSGIPRDIYTGDYMDNPNCALDRPTIDTTGDGDAAAPTAPMPVVPVYAAFHSYEVVTIGNNGYLIVKFDHPVRDDPHNKYGIDFIIFGNTNAVIDGSTRWYQQSDPASVTVVQSGGATEPGSVSVSQNGTNWYTFSAGPFADDFCPTLGRSYDPINPDPCAFPGNLYWGGATDPTIPVSPDLSFSDFVNHSVADICENNYGQSAGGTGFDISPLGLPTDPTSGLKWFQYIKVEDPDGNGTTEIDAFSDVAACGDWKHPYPAGDITGPEDLPDCMVDIFDLLFLAAHWLETTGAPDSIRADIYPDGRIDLFDLQIISDNYLISTWP